MAVAPADPSRDDVERTSGPLVIEFGASWCGICRATRPLIEGAKQRHGDVPHVRVEDGPGRPLGRSFGVKLWPTLVFLRDGHEVTRLVRPRHGEEVAKAFALVAGGES
jgi:thioredoxin 1